MSQRLLLDEHYANEIAERLREQGHDVVSVVADPALRAQPDSELFRWAAASGRRIVTENVKDFRPLLLRAYSMGESHACLLLVSPRRFPRGQGNRTSIIVKALAEWLTRSDAGERPDEDWLV